MGRGSWVEGRGDRGGFRDILSSQHGMGKARHVSNSGYILLHFYQDQSAEVHIFLHCPYKKRPIKTRCRQLKIYLISYFRFE